MNFDTIVSIAVNGVVLGATYALVAVGFSLVFGVLKKVNFANGAVFVVGSFAAGLLLTHERNALLALVVALVVGAALGAATFIASFWLTERSGDDLFPAMSSVALSVVVIELAIRVAGASQINSPAVISTRDHEFGPVSISDADLLVVGVTIGVFVLLQLVLYRTRFGLQARTLAEDQVMARLMGINTQRVVLIVFAVSGLLAALAGYLYSARIGVADSDSGFNLGVSALAVMVIAGLGDLRGAMWAGLLTGIVTVIALTYSSAGVAASIPWLLMLFILAVRPRGIFGRATW